MYKLDINFLKDRGLNEDAKKTSRKKKSAPIQTKIPLIAGLATLVALPLLTWGYSVVQNQQKAQLEAAIQQADAEIGQLQARNESVQQMQAELDQTRARREALVSVFNQIKPVSVLLQDLGDLSPPGVQINTIQQQAIPDPSGVGIPRTQLTITGLARSYNDVNDFLLTLQRSDFLNGNLTRIESAQSVVDSTPINSEDKPENLVIELPDLVNFSILTQVNERPASELIQQLNNKGATGLVTRITTLKERGAVAP